MGKADDKASTSNPSGEENNNQDEWQSIKTHLFLAALHGKYEVAANIFKANKTNLPDIVNATEETVLHVAAGAKRTDFVKKLLREPEDVINLRKKDTNGNTAFCTAVAAGASEIVNEFLTMNEHRDYFISTPGGRNNTALRFAALTGHEEIASILFRIVKGRTTFYPKEDEQKCIFFDCIRNDLYELAFEMLVDDSFACGIENAREPGTRETALHVLSRKPPSVFAATKMNGPFSFWKISSGSQSQSCVPQETPAVKLVIELWKRFLRENQYNNLKIKEEIQNPFNLLIDAAKFGNYDFLVVLISCYPELTWENYKDETIFHVAIKNRHVEIFKLIHETGLQKRLLETYEDDDGNNLLHLVAQKPQENRLRNIAGAALQMRQEILWYEEVKEIVIPSLRNKTNKKVETPEDLFTKEHEGLMEKSEMWMQKNAETGLIVATIIVTVIFQAAFGAPGDDKSKILAVILLILNTIAMSTSSIAIMLFLSILISRFTKDELFWSLPLSFIGGIISLFVSVTFMMVTFCLVTFSANKSTPIRICCSILLSLPVPLLSYLVYPILRDFVNSTFYSKRAFKPREPALRYIDPKIIDCEVRIDEATS